MYIFCHNILTIMYGHVLHNSTYLPVVTVTLCILKLRCLDTYIREHTCAVIRYLSLYVHMHTHTYTHTVVGECIEMSPVSRCPSGKTQGVRREARKAREKEDVRKESEGGKKSRFSSHESRITGQKKQSKTGRG